MESGHAPGLTYAKTRRINKMVENEFEARGISNFTNAGGTPKITHAGSYGGYSWEGFQQPAIQAQWTQKNAVMSPVHNQLMTPQLPSGPTSGSNIQPGPANTIPWSKMVPTTGVD